MIETDIGFVPEGEIKANPIRIIGLYIIGAFWAIGGIYLYFTTDRSLLILLMCLGGGAVFALISFVMSKTVYYWNDSQIAVVQPIVKPVVFAFDDINRIFIDNNAVTLELKNGKRYVIEQTCSGLNEFKEKIRSAADK